MKEYEVSVVMPCLNEEQTIGICIKKALAAFKKEKIKGEVVISDNGSTDKSVEISKSLGARVVHQPKKGYGNAYLKGLSEAKGKYIVMGDSDNTYDFLDIHRFLVPLRKGYDFVMGTRLKGNILPGAMPWLHKYIGNPFLSWFLNVLYNTKMSDSHCGMRSFTKKAFEKMQLKTAGMEFASEMVIRASKVKLKIKEIPIVYYPRKGEAKLNSFKDGWRHVRFMLLYSPTHLFLIPGLLLFLLGTILMTSIFISPLVHAHSLILSSLLILLGYNVILLGLFARTYAATHLGEKDRTIKAVNKLFNIERGIVLGLILFMIGLILGINIFIKWVAGNGGSFDEVYLTVLAATLMIVGIQTMFASFFLSIMGTAR